MNVFLDALASLHSAGPSVYMHETTRELAECILMKFEVKKLN
jgi:hypothetical protein